MIQSAHISMFDSLALSNGTSRFSTATITQPDSAPVRYMTLADRSLFDMDGATVSPVVPSQFTSETLLVATTPAALESDIATIRDKLGRKGVLVATYINSGTTAQCTARLERIERLTNKRMPHNQAKLRLSWRPLTDWV